MVKASILDVDADIIVMSANPSLLAGSGVSGVIHKAAGRELEEYVKPFAPLDIGQAIISPAFKLAAKYVVHTVCPRFYDGLRGEAEQLRAAYSNALAVSAEVSSARSIAFVAMGTGVYKWPTDLAASIAAEERSRSPFNKTLICVVDNRIMQAFETADLRRAKLETAKPEIQ